MSNNNLAHCSKAREILSSMGPIIAKANGSANKVQASQAVSIEYMKKINEINQNTVDAAKPEKLMEYLQTALMKCVFQLNAVNEVGNDAKSERGQDFMKMVHVEKMITKIQAKFRQKLAMKKLEKDVQKQKDRLAQRAKASKGASNEELALQEFKQRLGRKGLTPESFFRSCDPEYKKAVQVEKFKSQLTNFNL